MVENWKTGMMENWNDGMMEDWSIGVLEYSAYASNLHQGFGCQWLWRTWGVLGCWVLSWRHQDNWIIILNYRSLILFNFFLQIM